MFGKKSKDPQEKDEKTRRKAEEKEARKARRRAKYGRGSDAETVAAGISGIHAG
ncbi:hypothetical protein ACIRFH_34700 [Streptomyces sp. NPDC093586]|uniref:hypothetical protein n=1 Tax=Streptomyces sp. NPDC093586 TaxID=3366042 RepID=UPI0038131483